MQNINIINKLNEAIPKNNYLEKQYLASRFKTMPGIIDKIDKEPNFNFMSPTIKPKIDPLFNVNRAMLRNHQLRISKAYENIPSSVIKSRSYPKEFL